MISICNGSCSRVMKWLRYVEFWFLQLYFSLLWSFIIFFRSVLPTRYRSMEKSRLWERQKSRWNNWSSERAFFWQFFQYQLDCFLAFWLQNAVLTGWWNRETLYQLKLALWESKISRCHCFPCLLCFYVFSYHFLPLLWPCVNQWKLFHGFHLSKQHGI